MQGADAVKRKDDQASLGFIDALSSMLSAPEDIIGSALGGGKGDDVTISDSDAPPGDVDTGRR